MNLTKSDTRKLYKVLDMSITSIVMMVAELFAYNQTH